MALAIHTVGSTEGSNASSSLSLLSVTEGELQKNKQEVELKELAPARPGKKTQLMPTDGQQVKFNIQDYQKDGDPMSGTSIYFLLSNFYVNNLMQTNQEQMSANASALNANQNALDAINQGFQNLATIVSQPDTVDSSREGLFFWCGVGVGALLMVIGAVVTVFCPPVGIPLCLLGLGVIAAVVSVDVTNKDSINSGGTGTFSYLNDSQNTGGQALVNQTLAQALSGISTAENNETNRNMQNLQSVNSLQQQYANMFAQMMSYFSNSMGSK